MKGQNFKVLFQNSKFISILPQETFKATERTSKNYGLKRDLPLKTKLNYYQINEIDGDFNWTDLKMKKDSSALFEELVKAQKERTKVIGRLLNYCHEGISIGIGGFVCLLPKSDMSLFRKRDFLLRKPMEFFVKSADFRKGTPLIILSLAKQPSSFFF